MDINVIVAYDSIRMSLLLDEVHQEVSNVFKHSRVHFTLDDTWEHDNVAALELLFDVTSPSGTHGASLL